MLNKYIITAIGGGKCKDFRMRFESHAEAKEFMRRRGYRVLFIRNGW